MEKKHENEPENETKNILKDLAELAQRVVALVAYISIVGFLVESVLLKTSTSLRSYAVYPQEYIVTGTSFIVLVVDHYWWIFVGTLLIFEIAVILFLSWRKKTKVKVTEIISTSLSGIKFLFSSTYGVWILIALLILGLSYQADTIYSAASPLISGKSHTITLIFKENIDPLLWSLSIIPNEPKRTQPLQLLYEYTDSLLVKDISTGVVVKVKNEMIAGIIDNNSLILPTVTPVFSIATPTP